ncbi:MULTISPECIES: MobF family relaxase [Cyanophyceae]|uniref:Relaxase domain-containing protein n=1 Tax=Leptolyngbya subtilissima DQ-A4 TaxID=2933933 RepID=A0ABV0KCP2_9CYAN|nr:MobF family relaxase [Nodosilinea sp. FACHB-141]MBD2115182.1 relaxase domain-containing protein [Nodosilinea sp. FACHB-141]
MVATEMLLHLGSAKAPYYTKLGPEHYLGLSPNKDDDDEISLGHFDGEGAKVLGLFGEPIRENDQRFAALFQGLHPETYDPMRKGLTERTYDGKPRKAVVADDIVFSAPPAATAMFAAGSHETRIRVLASLEAAAKDTRAHIEKNYCFTRTGAGGSVRTQALPIWGCFTHIEDRAGMPQLHVHNVLFTSAVRQDGKYGALDLRPLLKRETIFEIGQVFRDSLRGHLAREFESSYLQFPNVPIKNGRSFTVQGYGGEEIPQGLLDRYSPRSKTIREALRNVPNPISKEVQAAVLRTRPEKPPVETAALRQQEWQTIAKKEFKFDTDSFLGRSRDQYIKQATDQAVFAVLRDRVKERQQLQQPQPSTFPSWQAKASKQAAAINRRAGALAKDRRRSASVPSGKVASAPKRDIWALTRSLVRRHSSNPQGKNRPQYSFEGALSDARAKSQKRAQRFRTKLRFLYYTSQIDHATYKKYTRPPKKQTRLAIETKYWTGQISQSQRLFLHSYSGHRTPRYGVPKSRLAINFSYATGQISRTQQLVLLKQNRHIKPNSPEIRVRRTFRHSYD